MAISINIPDKLESDKIIINIPKLNLNDLTISKNNNLLKINFKEQMNENVYLELDKLIGNFLKKYFISQDKKQISFEFYNSQYQFTSNQIQKNVEIEIVNTEDNQNNKTNIDDIVDEINTTLNQKENRNSYNHNKKESNVNLSIENSTNGNIKWIFNWKSDVASAIFTRGKYLWIIFNKKEDIDHKYFFKELQVPILNSEQIQNSDFTILRFKLAKEINPRVTKKSLSWIIEFPSFDKNQQFKPLNIIAQYNTPFSKGVFFPVENFAEPMLTILDPEIGDNLSVLTLYKGDYGVETKRNFVDFRLFESSQGIVIGILTDNTYIDIIKPGIEILSHTQNFTRNTNKIENLPEKHQLIEKQTNKITEEKPNIKEEKSLIKEQSFSSKNEQPTQQTKQVSNNKIVEKPKKTTLLQIKTYQEQDFRKDFSKFNLALSNATEEKKAPILMQLGKFFFFHKMYKESIATFELLEKDIFVPHLTYQIKFILAISLFMDNQYVKAKDALDMIEIKKLPKEEKYEIIFWKNLINYSITNIAEPINYLKNIIKFIQFYPQDIRVAIALKDIEQSLSDNLDSDTIRATMKEISNDTMDQHVKNNIKYFNGFLAKNNENYELALEIWKDLSEELDDRKNSLLAKLAFIELLVDKRFMPVSDAIFELNNLRMRWRGGAEEAKLLKKIGQLYHTQGDFINALRAWKGLISNHTTSNESLFIAAEMSNSFKDLFADENLHKLSDLQRVSLFYEFKELTPIGKEGDIIVRKVAQSMIKLDLLDHAANILLHQVNFRLAGKEKAEVATDLSLVYLMNRLNEKAIEIIETTESNDINVDLHEKREHIKAQAYINLKQYKKAMKILESDFSDIANDMKAYIFLCENNWKDLKRVLNVVLAERPYDLKPITQKDEQNIMKLGLCYYMLNDQDGLKSLATKFKILLEQSSKTKELIDILLADNNSIDFKRLEDTVKINEISSFIDKYKNDLTIPKNF